VRKFAVSADRALSLSNLHHLAILSRAAALATGCGVKLSVSRATMDIRPNPILAREFGATARNRYGVEYTGEGVFNASTDFVSTKFVRRILELVLMCH
jgi:hypothetical protein